MNTFTYLFLITLSLASAVQYWLARRQIAFVRSRRGAVPDAFESRIPLEAHQKAADYTVEKARFGHIEQLVHIVLLLLFTLGGGIDVLIDLWSGLALPPLAAGVGSILSVFVAMHVLALPLSIYHTFSIEERFGFNRTTRKRFLLDQGLQLLVTLIIGAPLLATVLWVMDSTGSLWWLLAWAVLLAFSVFMSWAYPTFIAPLFNRFTPLADAKLGARIQKLLNRCGFHSKGIFVMDGSLRSGHGNAYFTGLGSHKRIVFFDTLMNALEHEELEAVLAHELGHFKCRHVFKHLAASALLSLIGFAVLGWLIGQSWFYTGLGVSQASNPAALVLFALVSPVFTFFLQPLMAHFLRKHEFEADDFAAGFAAPSALISALVKLYRDNASTLTPDPLYSAFHYSHPPAAARIAQLAAKLDQPA